MLPHNLVLPGKSMAFPIKIPNDNVPGNVCVKKSADYIGHDQKWVQIKSGQQ
jgi:hypothetical protein